MWLGLVTVTSCFMDRGVTLNSSVEPHNQGSAVTVSGKACRRAGCQVLLVARDGNKIEVVHEREGEFTTF